MAQTTAQKANMNINTPKILVKLLNQRNQIFSLSTDKIRIGRGDDAELILPNVSVSRLHAIIEKIDGVFWIRDNGSQNGFKINQRNYKEYCLKSGDEIQIGAFSLVFLGERLEDNFYRGRSVIYLPQYDPKVFQSSEDSTFIMSNKDKNMLSRKTGLLHNGCITLPDGRFFYPEDNPISFGSKAVIPADGFFVFGIVAEINWNKSKHILTKKSWICAIKVNGKSISSIELQIGDQIQIGRTFYTYKLREGI
jgi:pSer/pThr/pTyr-binding forkhead associated (FHA) protein